MAALQEPEVQFAQRLASNEKPVRTKAVKKLRKYINGRSQKAAGGFTGDELLKLWKGLFYCLWMQDKPLLQEELSNLISSLIHSFHSIDGQFLYLESFLQTFKREWTGIDRLRMDKFFQLVRFMFRQTFEMLKRKNWESSVVGRFLELLTAQLLQSGSEAPSGLRFHILDLYMTELALLGSAELTADQNLTFIEPFCKTAAKTKDRTLFRAICSSIFSTIIDQAPFAIDDLMKEMKAAEASDSDSGQASEEEEEEEEEDEQKENTKTSKPVGKKGPKKQINGHKSHDDDDDDDDDELLHLDDLDTELPGDSDVGPVLQFDYAALADKLFVLASRSSTPSHNRQRLYKIIKVLRDLSEGIFPQDEYPDEVSTDEDDEMFGSRKRMKRGGGFKEEEDGAPSAKKRKGKKKEASSLDQSKDSGQDTSEAADVKKKRRKKKKKKKKVGQAGSAAGEEKSEQEQPAALTQSTGKDTEAGSQAEDSETQISVSSVKVTEAAAPESQSETLLLVEVKTQAAVTVTDEDQSETLSKKKTKRETSVLEPEATEERQTPVTQEEEAAETSGKKKKKKKKTGLKAESQVNAEAETTPETDAATLAKRNKMEDAGSQVTDADITPAGEEASQDVTTVPLKKKAKKKGLKMDQDEEETDKTRELSAAADPGAATPLKKKRKKSQKESEPAAPVEEADKLLHEMTTTTPAKKKKLAAEADGGVDMKAPPVDTEVGSSSGKLAKKKKKKIPVTFEFEADEVTAATSINGSAEEAAGVEDPSTPLSTKRPKKKTKASSGSDFVSFQSETTVPTPLFCRTKGSPSTPLSRKKKSQTPKSESKKVTFGLKNNKTAEFRKTDRSLLVSPDGSSRVPFDPQQKPKFGVLKSPPTLRSTSVKKTPNRKKSVATPKSTPKRRPSAADFF